ncbi:MAG TPA: putative quinol monooxygenase [Phytomonospora sp.]
MESHVLIVADTSCAPENAEEFGRVVARFAEHCRAEPGCLSYEIFRSPDRPERYVSLEKYVDAEAFAAHRASEHFREVGVGQVMPLVVERDVQLYGAPQDVTPTG